MKIKFHGQSCFEITDGDATVVVDPFLKPNNPVAVHTADEVEATHVLLTHGHADHIADAVGLCKRTGAPAVAIVETAGWLGDQGVEETFDPNLGGTVEFDWGSVKLVQAFHTNTMPGSGDEPLQRGHGHAGRPGRRARHHDRRQDDLPRRRHLPLRRHGADRAAPSRSTSRSCRSAATTRWTATTRPSPPA